MKAPLVRPLCLTALIAALSFSTAAAQGGENSSISDSESYAVYASILPQFYPVQTAPKAKVSIQKETETYPERGGGKMCQPSPTAAPEEWRPAVESYLVENAKVRFLLPNQQPLPEYTVLPKAEIKVSFVQFSAVGFNASKTRAVVYAAFCCGNQCAGGRHYFMEKTDGAWRHVAIRGLTVCVWES